MKIFILYLAIMLMLVEVQAFFGGNTIHVSRLRSVRSLSEKLERVGNLLNEMAEAQAAFTKKQLETQEDITKMKAEFEKTRVQADKSRDEVNIMQLKNEKQLGQLIGYNQNQDSSLEYSLALPLKNFILQTCRVP